MRGPTLLLLLAFVGCGDPDVSTGRDSSAREDTGVNIDGSVPDAAPVDTGPADGSSTDGGGTDSSAPPRDAGSTSAPSWGSGGVFPGVAARTTTAPGGGTLEYIVYLPGTYDPSRAIAVVTLFHGQGGSGANMVDFWSGAAEDGGFALLATTSTGSSGGWSGGSDVARFDAALTDALGAYNVEQKRIYVWGFSAGAHLTHAIALMNTDLFAAYSVSAGVLDAFAGSGAPGAAGRRIPVDIHIGTADPLYAGAASDRTTFIGAGWTEGGDLSWSPFDGGHALLPAHPGEIWSFLAPHRLP